MGPEISENRLARLAEIRENNRKLRECARHRFEEMPKPLSGQSLTCASCGGDADPRTVFSYVQGFIAAGGDPLVVAPWWLKALARRWRGPTNGEQLGALSEPRIDPQLICTECGKPWAGHWGFNCDQTYADRKFRPLLPGTYPPNRSDGNEG